MRFGIEHDFGDVGWTLCTAGMEIAEDGWPASGTGNALVWLGGCHRPEGGTALIGFLSVIFSEDITFFAYTQDPRIGFAEYADCSVNVYEICDQNLAGGEFDPVIPFVCGDQCDAVPTANDSGSRLKTLF